MMPATMDTGIQLGIEPEHVLDSIDGWLWAVDRDLRLVQANARARRDLRAVLGRDVQLGESICLPELSAELTARWRSGYVQALAGAQGVVLVEKQLVPGVVMRCALSPLRRGAEVVGVVLTGQDVTSLVGEVEEARTAEQRIREVTQRSWDEQLGIQLVETETVVYREAKARFDAAYYTRILRIANGNVSLAAKLADKTRKELYDAARRLGLDLGAYRAQQRMS